MFLFFRMVRLQQSIVSDFWWVDIILIRIGHLSSMLNKLETKKYPGHHGASNKNFKCTKRAIARQWKLYKLVNAFKKMSLSIWKGQVRLLSYHWPCHYHHYYHRHRHYYHHHWSFRYHRHGHCYCDTRNNGMCKKIPAALK